MAKKTCPACGAPVSAGEDFCSFCGALIPRNEASSQTQSAAAQAVQSTPETEAPRVSRRVQTPKTIEELLAFCERHELPLSKMRFFIGLDYPGAKAYGIYQDQNGDFVVYKNKADGSRAVRYRGPDEAHAVNELFQKLKEEATGQRARVASARKGTPVSSPSESRSYPYSDQVVQSRRPKKKKAHGLLIGIIAVAAAITIVRTVTAIQNNTPFHSSPSTGYYHYNDQYYYNQNDDWYLYNNDIGCWYPIYTIDDELTDNYGDYYSSYSYFDDYGVENFADSGYYDSYSGSSSSYSSDWDSSDSDWDSSDSDWDWDWDDDDDWDSSSDWDWDSDWDSDWGDWDSDW